jgi:hypothetical protein
MHQGQHPYWIGSQLASGHIQTHILLRILRPTACIRIRLRIPTRTRTRTTSTSATARRPRPSRRRLPSRRTSARRAVLGIQQALEEVLQHLVLRRAGRAPEDRRRRRACAPAETEAAKRGARAAALHLCQRMLDCRQ